MIRPALASDLDAVLALWARGRSEHAATEDTPADVARAIGAGSLLVVEEGGTLIGSLGDAAAEGLWAAAGYTDDRDIGRWVRNL